MNINSVEKEASEVTVDGPTIVEGVYDTEYYLTLETIPAEITTPTGEGWYKAGTYSSISTDLTVGIDTGSRYYFDEWTTPQRRSTWINPRR